jgi:asparagine synthase (glutamine-hydrolysing)
MTLVDRSVAGDVRRHRLTYLSAQKFESLYDCLDRIVATDVPGDYLEFGVALGGSGVCLARALDGARRYVGFDVFGMIPPPSGADGLDVIERYATIAAGRSTGIGGDRYYGYVDNLYDVVRQTFARFGRPVDGERVELVKGLFEETLPGRPDAPIALAHIDCDWFEPVTYCLDYVWPRLSPGGFMVLDDYNDWSGCRKATDGFLAAHADAGLVRAVPHAVIQKPGVEP